MSSARSRWLWWLVLILGLAFALRAFRLDAVPLRGDEGFTVRYWAADPRNLVHDVRRQEPHPVGTFVAFWAWKQTAGDTELAMRYLPLLGNLIGVAAMAGLGRRLLHSERAGLIAAALWAINPHLIWHAQDVRNYAIWAGLSALALWLFVRAADRNRPRDWLLYAAAETLALYTFFLEAFFVAGQALYLLLARRDRRVLRAAVAAWALVGILLIPLFVQVYFFTQTGYRGAVGDADPVALLTEFLPTLLIGDVPPAPWDAALPLAWIALVAVAWTLRKPPRPRVGAWLALSVLIPSGLLLIAAGRMSVFHPRYILAATPALILLTTWALLPLFERRDARPAQTAITVALLGLPLLGAVVLVPYYRGDDPKAPDWPGLVAFLRRVRSLAIWSCCPRPIRRSATTTTNPPTRSAWIRTLTSRRNFALRSTSAPGSGRSARRRTCEIGWPGRCSRSGNNGPARFAWTSIAAGRFAPRRSRTKAARSSATSRGWWDIRSRGPIRTILR